MRSLGKTMTKMRSDLPPALPGRGAVLLVMALMGGAAPLPAQSRATVQISAQVMAVQPSAEALQVAQALARSEDPASVRARGRVPLATVRRTVQGTLRARPVAAPRQRAASPAAKPTSMVEIQFLRN